MKKITMIMTLFVASLLLVACNNNTSPDGDATGENGQSTSAVDHQENDDAADDTTVEDDKGTGTSQQTGDAEDMAAKMDELPYEEFELDIEYANGVDYEVDLEKRRDGTVKAKIEDEINNVKLTDQAAFDEIFPLVQSLSIGKDTEKEAAIQEILEKFNLANDYIEFELEIKFKDGTEINFKDPQ